VFAFFLELWIFFGVKIQWMLFFDWPCKQTASEGVDRGQRSTLIEIAISDYVIVKCNKCKLQVTVTPPPPAERINYRTKFLHIKLR
jgi:hypothetical protein